MNITPATKLRYVRSAPMILCSSQDEFTDNRKPAESPCLREMIVNDEYVKDAIEVEKEDTIGESIIESEAQNDGLREHDSKGQCCNESQLLRDIDLACQNGDLVAINSLGFGSFSGNDQSRESLWNEAHNNGEAESSDHVDQV